jgi:hypothetical protein
MGRRTQEPVMMGIPLDGRMSVVKAACPGRLSAKTSGEILKRITPGSLTN